MATRSPICVVVGHVDHGKSSILDYIRGTNICSKEAGGITQAIGASIVPMDAIKKCAGTLMAKMQFTIPGLLFIDTPGHAAFTSLRKRGGNLADIAILVVDINEGLKPQSIEAMQILKESKTPFVVAANKIDMVHGFSSKKAPTVVQSIALQQPHVIQDVETKMYALVGALYDLGFKCERFDRVSDYTQELAIIPTSAHTGEGMPELLMVVSGLAQKYLEQQLKIDVSGPAVGTILEVKEEKGLGKTLDVIIYDGTLRTQDEIVIGDMSGPIHTKVRVLLQPNKVVDMRDKSAKFIPIKEAIAATGVKISAQHIDTVIAGMPIRAVGKLPVDQVKAMVQKDVTDVIIQTDQDGIILKADTLGGIEALITLCRLHQIPIRMATVGEISRRDILDAESNFEKEPTLSCVLGFNIASVPSTDKVHIITSPIIYQLIDAYKEWKQKLEHFLAQKEAADLKRPGKVLFMQGYAFRQSNPAIIGVDVLGGVLPKGSRLIKKDGSTVGIVRGVQLNKADVAQAEYQQQVAASIEGATIGRQIIEGDILFVDLEEDEFRRLKEHKKQLAPHEIEVLKEFAEIKRKENPVWGI